MSQPAKAKTIKSRAAQRRINIISTIELSLSLKPRHDVASEALHRFHDESVRHAADIHPRKQMARAGLPHPVLHRRDRRRRVADDRVLLADALEGQFAGGGLQRL